MGDHPPEGKDSLLPAAPLVHSEKLSLLTSCLSKATPLWQVPMSRAEWPGVQGRCPHCCFGATLKGTWASDLLWVH